MPQAVTNTNGRVFFHTRVWPPFPTAPLPELAGRMQRLLLGACLLLIHHAAAFSFLGGGSPTQLRFRNTALPLAPSRSRLTSSSSPLALKAQIKFADAVETVLKKQFKSKKMRRVIDSWRRSLPLPSPNHAPRDLSFASSVHHPPAPGHAIHKTQRSVCSHAVDTARGEQDGSR